MAEISIAGQATGSLSHGERNISSQDEYYKEDTNPGANPGKFDRLRLEKLPDP